MTGVIIAIMLTILVTALVVAISFVAGVRYGTTSYLPGRMARMTEKELDDLADAVTDERRAMGFDVGDESEEGSEAGAA